MRWFGGGLTRKPSPGSSILPNGAKDGPFYLRSISVFARSSPASASRVLYGLKLCIVVFPPWFDLAIRCRFPSLWMPPPKTIREKVHHPCVRLPGNESLELERTDWEIAMPRFPAALDGLKIVHLSDLHFTGRIGKAYFREVVRAANECKPDIIAITGDIVDRQCCISWVPDTLGELNARYGVFFILGNHDLQVNTT